MVVSGQLTLIIAAKGVGVFVLVSQTMAVTRGTQWDQCIFYYRVALDSVFHIINQIEGQHICQLRLYKYIRSTDMH